MQTIAIIGTGISGMGAGYLLRNDYDITFYEKNDYAGGHTNTLTVNEDGQEFQFGPGDYVVFPKGMKCRWQIKQDVRKHYNFG